MGVALGGSCTITNTVNSDTIVVNKDFSPDSADTVSVGLTCTTGTASHHTVECLRVDTGSVHGDRRRSGRDLHSDGDRARRLHAPISLIAWVWSWAEAVRSATRSTSNMITVNKDFRPNSIATVPVALTCTSGAPVELTPLNASESAPAVFTVTGADPGAKCTATETVPAGYTANQTNCVDVAAGRQLHDHQHAQQRHDHGQQGFQPQQYRHSAGGFDLYLWYAIGDCHAAERVRVGSPAVFTVTGADRGATCTATETVPARLHGGPDGLRRCAAGW